VSGFVLVLALGLAGLAGYLAYANWPAYTPGERPAAATPAPAGDPDAAIGALGRVQPAAGILSAFGPPGDRVLDLKVGVGDAVKVGQLLATLSGDDARQAAVDALTSQLAEADALRQSLNESRDARLMDAEYEVAAADAKLESELAGLAARVAVLGVQQRRAARELERLQKAQRDGLPVSEQELLQAQTAADQMAAEAKAAADQQGLLRNQQTKAAASLAAKKKLIEAEAKRGLAQVPTDSLLVSKRAAERKLEDGRLVAHRAGRVVKVLARPGDVLGSAPAVQIADPKDLVVLAEVYETDVARLRGWLAGGKLVPAEIDGRVLGDGTTLKGTVTPPGVAPMIARNQVFALGPREDADRRVVEVEVKLEPAAAARLADYLGLQVRVTLRKP
jgi:HlyD family secretion protein